MARTCDNGHVLVTGRRSLARVVNVVVCRWGMGRLSETSGTGACVRRKKTRNGPTRLQRRRTMQLVREWGRVSSVPKGGL